MGGDVVHRDWQGKLNITYRYGPGFINDQWKVKMDISTHNKRATTYNVIGFIRGHVEPDRYVIVGNHRDAWVFGALDPSSGSASMLELSRVFGQLVKEGWRPRRTLVFASWGAEEHGLIGSTEWVENYIKTLGERTVAYLNVDIGLQGNYTIRALATPIMYSVLYETAKKVPNPNPLEIAEGRETVYDTWVFRTPTSIGENKGKPFINPIGSGSDYTGFIQLAGIPSSDIRYTYDIKLKIKSYPLYHSVYETFHVVDDIMDKDFKYLTATTQVWGELARSLADELVIPFDVMEYSYILNKFTDKLIQGFGSLMASNGLQSGLNFLKKAVSNFGDECNGFKERLQSVDRNDPMAVRMMNDQMIQLERAFIDPNGLPGRPEFRHVLLAPSQHDSYAASGYPGLRDLMYKIDEASNTTAQWERVKRYLSVVIYTIDSAASTLRDVTKIHSQG